MSDNENAAFAPDYPGATVRPSPNFGPRKDGKQVSILILHYTGTENGAVAEELLSTPEREVSAHYVVHEDGRVVQMVAESKRAWHAGQSFWLGETDINSCSVGIEIVNPGPLADFPDFPDTQIEAVIALSRDICARHSIEPRKILAHSDIAPLRKIDPGEKFPWERLYRAGLGHWVEPSPIRGGRFLALGDRGQPVEALQSMLALYGYYTPVDGILGMETEAAVKAFQRHFRPQKVDGVADVSTIETLHRLLSALPALAT
ncbi:N-acetylmuramoyl-L-alanine amidase [Brucella sp. IR073]|uniref:peptidoglycan recognition protein family protein n=1 Tax=unclassified Brucella TaxID=2632610 RepID=UPI003B980C17